MIDKRCGQDEDEHLYVRYYRLSRHLYSRGCCACAFSQFAIFRGATDDILQIDKRLKGLVQKNTGYINLKSPGTFRRLAKVFPKNAFAGQAKNMDRYASGI